MATRRDFLRGAAAAIAGAPIVAAGTSTAGGPPTDSARNDDDVRVELLDGRRVLATLRRRRLTVERCLDMRLQAAGTVDLAGHVDGFRVVRADGVVFSSGGSIHLNQHDVTPGQWVTVNVRLYLA